MRRTERVKERGIERNGVEGRVGVYVGCGMWDVGCGM